MKRKRDDFSKTTILKLGQRVAFRCSFPKCNRATVGPVISNSTGVTIVGRACHIEAASEGGPRFNQEMTAEQRKGIDNGIWCCGFHANIIDNDVNTFSVSTLREWKKIAEASAYHEIDTSSVKTDYPDTLVQLGDDIIFRAVWYDLNVEERRVGFRVVEFVYGDFTDVESFIHKFEFLKKTKIYFVVESQGYGRLLSKKPELRMFAGQSFIELAFEERTEFSSPDQFFDIPLSFTEEGTDIQISEEETAISVTGFVAGKKAVVQSIQMLLGSNRGEWSLDPEMGSYLFMYYKDHHMDHNLLTSLIKLEISRMTSIPETDALGTEEPHIPVSSVNWVESVTISGHSDNLLSVVLKLHFTDNSYYENTISVPASFKDRILISTKR